MPADPDPVLHTPSAGAAKTHWSTDVKFPVYAVSWIDDEHVILAGGGGGSRTGVRNRLVSLASVEEEGEGKGR